MENMNFTINIKYDYSRRSAQRDFFQFIIDFQEQFHDGFIVLGCCRGLERGRVGGASSLMAWYTAAKLGEEPEIDPS